MSAQQPSQRWTELTATVATSPMWEPRPAEASEEERIEPSSWAQALDALGAATMADHQQELLYSQAPDALRQAGIEASSERIEAWVVAQLANVEERSSPERRAT